MCKIYICNHGQNMESEEGDCMNYKIFTLLFISDIK